MKEIKLPYSEVVRIGDRELEVRISKCKMCEIANCEWRNEEDSKICIILFDLGWTDEVFWVKV